VPAGMERNTFISLILNSYLKSLFEAYRVFLCTSAENEMLGIILNPFAITIPSSKRREYLPRDGSLSR